MSERSDIEIPISPVEQSSNVDLAHPSERCREPRITDRRAGRNGRKVIDVDFAKKTGKGMRFSTRRIRWPELFHNSRYPVQLIEDLARENPPRPDVAHWVDDIIATGGKTGTKKKYVVCRHPGFNRDALFELVHNPKHGPVYRCVSIAHTGGREGYLPPDLQTSDGRWEHLRGDVGDRRQFTRKDFELIRECADRDEKTATELAKKIAAKQKDEYNEKNRVENDYVADMLDYNFLRINTAANNGTKQYSLANVETKENRDRYYIEERNGYRLRVKRDSRIAKELEQAKRAGVLDAIKKENAELARKDLILRANAITRGLEIKRRKTL